jgi:serpin B
MLSAFELATADFSLLSTTPMFVTGVFHDAHVIVDEDGVEAAGATVIIGGPGAGPPEPTATVTLDRPFVFFIRDVQSNVNLFAGHYAQP